MHGTNVCYHHGGPGALATIESGCKLKHGRYARHLPTDLRETYERERSDPDMLRLQDEIAMARTFLVGYIDRAEGSIVGGRDVDQVIGLFERVASLVERDARIKTMEQNALSRANALAFVARCRDVMQDIIARYVSDDKRDIAWSDIVSAFAQVEG